MTNEMLAKELNGNEMHSEITGQQEKLAKESGLVVVFGYSDDNAELRGAINDEFSCYGGGAFYVNQDGLLAAHDERGCECEFCGYEAAKANARKIEAVWGQDGYSWTYKTDIPHAGFDILEDGEKFCRGIVFSMADLKA